ncbi:MAG: hypothetical protein ACYTG1_01620 [Planctomycetota bacterium]|jgi:hypothetical protein
MRGFRLRDDLERVAIGGFALPLGIEPGSLAAPTVGFTLSYNTGHDDDPDTYTFHVVVSHERVAATVRRVFELLPEAVFPIVEIGSRDAYRTTDVYVAGEPMAVGSFRESWALYEPILLEDGSLGAGANSDEPFVEVFLDQWKGISIHVPLDMRDDVETLLQAEGLHEVPQTWPVLEDDMRHESRVRPVLDVRDEFSPDLDELLLHLRHDWGLELNVDPDTNVDESGRRVGMTLWHAVVIVEPADGDPQRGAYGSVWATAGSLGRMEELIDDALAANPSWVFSEIYTIDRVAYDERPDALADLPPRRGMAEVHLVEFEPWTLPPDGAERTGP